MVNCCFFNNGTKKHILYVVSSKHGNVLIDPMDDELNLYPVGNNWITLLKRQTTKFKIYSIIRIKRKSLILHSLFMYNCVEIGRMLTGIEVSVSVDDFRDRLIESGGKEVLGE